LISLNLTIQALVWVRWAIQNWALAKQTHTVLHAGNIEATSIVSSWLFGISSVYGCFYALYTSAPAVYFWSSAFSVACQGLVLFRLHRKPKDAPLEPAPIGVRR
jgi:hypothetical protein